MIFVVLITTCALVYFSRCQTFRYAAVWRSHWLDDTSQHWLNDKTIKYVLQCNRVVLDAREYSRGGGRRRHSGTYLSPVLVTRLQSTSLWPFVDNRSSSIRITYPVSSTMSPDGSAEMLRWRFFLSRQPYVTALSFTQCFSVNTCTAGSLRRKSSCSV